MGKHRWYILDSILWDYAYDVTLAVLKPTLFLPVLGGYTGGFSVPKEAGYYLMVLINILVINSCLSVTITFVYRVSQVYPGRLHDFIENNKKWYVFNVAHHLFFYVCFVVPVAMYAASVDPLALLGGYANYMDFDGASGLFVFERTPLMEALCCGLSVVCIFFFFVGLALAFALLNRICSSTSISSRRVQLMYFRAFLVQLCLAYAFMLIPLAILGIAAATATEYGHTIANGFFMMTSVHATLDMCAFFYFIAPFRKALKLTIAKIVSFKRKAATTEPPKNADKVTLPLMTVDDLHYAVNVSIGTNSTNSQHFTLTVDLKESDTTLADVSLERRHGRGFVLNNASIVVEKGQGYYIMDDYVQFSPSVGFFLKDIVVINQWNASDDFILPFTSQPFDGVFGLLDPGVIHVYSVSLDKTCSNGTIADGGTLTLNGLDSRNCGEFAFVNRTQNMCPPFLTVPSIGVLVDDVLDLSANSVVVADVPYIYLPTTTFNRLNQVYNAQKEGDIYVVDCDANPAPLEIVIDNAEHDDAAQIPIELNYTDLIERIHERRCAFLVRPSTGAELECFGGTVSFILGLPFLQRYCIAATSISEDYETMRIGFAAKSSERHASRVCDYRGFVPAQGGLRPSLIVLIVVATLVALCFITAVGYCCYRRRRKAATQQKIMLSGFPHYTLPPVSVFNSLFHQFSTRTDPWQIHENELDLSTAREIGSGAFAKVFVVDVKKSLEKKLNKQASAGGRKTKAVVKVARRTSEEIKHDMHQEVDLMKELGSHTHIVNFIGYVAAECPLIVMEYCANGDL